MCVCVMCVCVCVYVCVCDVCVCVSPPPRLLYSVTWATVVCLIASYIATPEARVAAGPKVKGVYIRY